MNLPVEGILINLDSIINETLDSLLTRKADYTIILKYAVFLLEIGRIDKAITRLQIFNFDPRFMNNGELLFYKGLLEFIKLDNEKECESQFNANYNSFLLNFNKCIGLIKNDEVLYMDWILNFLHRNCLYNEISQFLQNEKLKSIIELAYPRKYSFFKAIIDNDHSNEKLKQKILEFSEELQNNLTDINLFYKLFELINSYYEENHDDNYNEQTYIFKFAHLNPNIILNVIKFLSNFIVFDELNKPKKSNINNKLNKNNQMVNIGNKPGSPGKEDFSNLNSISDSLIEDKYLEIFKEILCDIKNYVFWINHKNYVEALAMQNSLSYPISVDIERKIYEENFFIVSEPVNKDMVLLKSLLWDLYKNLVLVKFKKDFSNLLKKIINDFSAFMLNVSTRNRSKLDSNSEFEYSKLAKVFSKKHFGYQLDKAQRIYKILNVLNEIIFYKEITEGDFIFVDFGLLEDNLMYAFKLIKNLSDVVL